MRVRVYMCVRVRACERICVRRTTHVAARLKGQKHKHGLTFTDLCSETVILWRS